MANFFVPSKQILTPELLIPGQVPVGPVVANKTHQHNISTVGWWLATRAGPLPDLIGNSSGTLVNSPSISTVAGKRALLCNGSTQYADFGDHTKLDGATEFTISCEIYIVSGGINDAIVRKWRAGAASYFLGLANSDALKFYFGVTDGTNNCIAETQSQLATTGIWHKTHFRWPGGNTLSAFIDGVNRSVDYVATDVVTSVNATNEHLCALTRWNDGSPDLHLNGAIRNIRISNRAITDAECLRLDRHPYESLRPPGPEYLTFPAGAAPGTITGTGAITLPSILVSGTAERSIIGSGTPALPINTLSGTAGKEVKGSGTPSLPINTLAGTAGKEVKGSGTPDLLSITLDGTANIGGTITGTGAFTLPVIALSGTATTQGVWTDITNIASVWTDIPAHSDPWS